MATSTNSSQVVITTGPGECSDVKTYHAHHRNFPEVRGEGESESEALERLRTNLELAVEHLSGGHGLDAMQTALNDVRQQQSVR